jgi:hypothetical protein
MVEGDEFVKVISPWIFIIIYIILLDFQVDTFDAGGRAEEQLSFLPYQRVGFV